MDEGTAEDLGIFDFLNYVKFCGYIRGFLIWLDGHFRL